MPFLWYCIQIGKLIHQDVFTDEQFRLVGKLYKSGADVELAAGIVLRCNPN